MKNIFIMLFFILSTVSARAADFTISVSGGSSVSAYGDGVLLGPANNIGNIYITQNGLNWLVGTSPNTIDANGYGDYLASIGSCFFESSDCSGDCLLPSTAGASYIIEKSALNFGSARTQILVMSTNTATSNGSLVVNSCMNSYSPSCSSSPSSCSGSSVFLTGNTVKNGVVLKRGTIYNRLSYPNLPAHNFSFKNLTIK